MRSAWYLGALCAMLVVGCGPKAAPPSQPATGPTAVGPATPPVVPPPVVAEKPFADGTVVYRFDPTTLDAKALQNGIVVKEGLPEGAAAGVAAQAYQNQWYAKRIFYVPGKPLLKVTTKTRLQFWCKVDGATGYLMQFFSAARDDNVKHSVKVDKAGEWTKVDVGLIRDMGFDIGQDVSELAWHIGTPGDDKVSLVVSNVVFYEAKE